MPLTSPRTLSVVAVATACACVAFPAASSDVEHADGALSEVIVTGSRIPTSTEDETMPVIVLDATDLARGGYDSLSRVLQTLPMSASSVHNTNNNNGGDGASRTDLRALEPKRTLVLLNGHRFPNGGIGGDNAVDVDMLPTSLIDRVEVLTSGASAIYGADAVAGVINFITKPSSHGLDASCSCPESMLSCTISPPTSGRCCSALRPILARSLRSGPRRSIVAHRPV
jgi:iron complex outermembrane receptor protein